MKNFAARIHGSDGDTESVVLSCSKDKNVVNVIVDFTKYPVTLKIIQHEIGQLKCFLVHYPYSDNLILSCSYSVSGERDSSVSVELSLNQQKELCMQWVEYYIQDKYFTYSHEFYITMERPELEEFLRYIIEGFTE